VVNDLDPEERTPSRGDGTGIGLVNVRRRLDAAYGHRARLTAAAGAEVFRAELVLPAGEPPAAGGGQ
jgi:LytS/YehU family sensor histidine kinase